MALHLKHDGQVDYAEEEYVRRRVCDAIEGMTNAAAARVVGVSHETIRRIRFGDPPSLRVVIGVCRELEADPCWILMGKSGGCCNE